MMGTTEAVKVQGRMATTYSFTAAPTPLLEEPGLPDPCCGAAGACRWRWAAVVLRVRCAVVVAIDSSRKGPAPSIDPPMHDMRRVVVCLTGRKGECRLGVANMDMAGARVRVPPVAWVAARPAALALARCFDQEGFGRIACMSSWVDRFTCGVCGHYLPVARARIRNGRALALIVHRLPLLRTKHSSVQATARARLSACDAPCRVSLHRCMRKLCRCCCAACAWERQSGTLRRMARTSIVIVSMHLSMHPSLIDPRSSIPPPTDHDIKPRAERRRTRP